MALKQKNHTTDKLTILAILSVVFLFGTSAFSGTGKTAPKSVTFYEEANYTFKNNDEQLYAVRRNPLWAITCGAKGHAVGHSKIYPFKEGWQKALDEPNSIMVKNLTRLMGEIQWWTLVPDQYHEVGINGFGNFGGEHYID